MKLLLDTHVFLWYLARDPRLPARFRGAIQNSENAVYVSAASIWEVVIKNALGKLPMPASPAEYLPKKRALHQILSLPIDEGAMPFLAALPPIHADPFDRMLIAQAQQHGLTLVTVDSRIISYGAPTLSTTVP